MLSVCGDFDNSKPPTAVEIRAFLEQYGTLVADQSGAADALTYVSVAQVRKLQETLRWAWRRLDARPLWFPEGFGAAVDYFSLPFALSDRGVVMRPNDCWTYARMLLTCDIATGHAKVCASARCPRTPYFVSDRVDARYCSTLCGGGERVKKFRSREKRRKT